MRVFFLTSAQAFSEKLRNNICQSLENVKFHYISLEQFWSWEIIQTILREHIKVMVPSF